MCLLKVQNFNRYQQMKFYHDNLNVDALEMKPTSSMYILCFVPMYGNCAFLSLAVSGRYCVHIIMFVGT